MAEDVFRKLEAAQTALDKSAGPASPAAWTQPWSPEIVNSLALYVLGFTFLTLVLASIVIWRHESQPQQVVRIFGLLTILGLSAVLLVVGYSNEQLTPIIGLFGAIAGYLLGKDSTGGKS